MTEEQFHKSYTKTETCWLWNGNVDSFGRAHIWFDGKMQLASRVAYKLSGQPLLDTDKVCHTCDNGGCLNPAHMFKGTQQDNVTDMCNKGRHANTNKTHCPKGHEYTEDNIYYRGERRECRKCRQESTRKYNEIRNKRNGWNTRATTLAEIGVIEI